MGNGSSFVLPEKAVIRISMYLSARDIVRAGMASKSLYPVSLDNKIWRTKCLQIGWGGRVTSTHVIRKKWKEVFIQKAMLTRQRKLMGDVAKAKYVRGPKNIAVLLMGFDRSGKTSFLYRLKLGRLIVSIPTVGANCETVTQTVQIRGAPTERSFKITDVGGIPPMRPLWKEYSKDASKIDIFAFMVDSCDDDEKKLQEAAYHLKSCLDLIGSKPVIVLGSKFDLHRACSAHQLCKKMQLRKLFDGLKNKVPVWSCHSISNSTGQGIAEALDWMVWACNPTETECWFCRNEETVALQPCSNCGRKHCASCLQKTDTSLLCKFCFYCKPVGDAKRFENK